MSRSGFQYALAALDAIATDGEFDHGVLRSIVGGLSAAANTGRELSDLEQIALDNLMGQLVPASEGDVSASATSTTGEEDIVASPSEEPASEAEVSANEEEPSGGEASAPEPSIAPAPSEDLGEAQEEQSSGGEPETAGDALAASQSSVTSDAGEPAPAALAPEGGAEAEPLFQPQTHDEDDGA